MNVNGHICDRSTEASHLLEHPARADAIDEDLADRALRACSAAAVAHAADGLVEIAAADRQACCAAHGRWLLDGLTVRVTQLDSLREQHKHKTIQHGASTY